MLLVMAPGLVKTFTINERTRREARAASGTPLLQRVRVIRAERDLMGAEVTAEIARQSLEGIHKSVKNDHFGSITPSMAAEFITRATVEYREACRRLR